MFESPTNTRRLLDRALQGDEDARRDLLELHREDLRRMVEARLDRRIAARVDASDVVQDALIEAARRLEHYLTERPLPYFAWLRQIAAERVIDTHRRHVSSQRRSILREEHGLEIPDESAVQLIARIFADDTSPSNRVVRKERNEQLTEALAALSARDREVLVMRHLEQLSTAAIAEALGISEGAVKARLLRGLLRLRGRLRADSSDGDHA